MTLQKSRRAASCETVNYHTPHGAETRWRRQGRDAKDEASRHETPPCSYCAPDEMPRDALATRGAAGLRDTLGNSLVLEAGRVITRRVKDETPPRGCGFIDSAKWLNQEWEGPALRDHF